MRLSDIMSAAGLVGWAEIGLLVSFITFIGIAVYLFSRRRAHWEHARRLPLEDDLGAPSRHHHGEEG